MSGEPQVLANRYRVLGELGRGGMGVVYRVADPLQGDREVALKAIAGAVTNDHRLRFREEFRAMTRLAHPNLLAVYDFGLLEDGAPYFTMELVPGEDLEGRGPLAPRRVYELLIQLLQALDFIHARGYVHRDIKSANIRVTPEGRLVLMDFGLMAQLGQPSAGGTITGTPGYLPPEVVRGGVIDAGSDLYSVGCLAFELLTGNLPFKGSVIEVVRQHVNARPPALRDVPEALDRIVQRLLEKEPARRYRDAAEVVSDLAGLAGVAMARPSRDQQRSYLVNAPLIGREPELARLGAALERVRGGQGAAVLVGAPAGVGKSRLMRDASLQAALDGLLVLEGRCLEHGMAPYEPLAQALRPLLAIASPLRRPLLAHVFPELGEAPAAEKAAIDREVAGWLAEHAASRPLALYLEDLQWCDDRSLEVFCQVLREVAQMPVLALGAFRSDELPAKSPLWYPIEDGQADYLPLEPFGRAQVAAMLDAMLGPLPDADRLAGALHDATGGNAFFVAEVARYLLDEGVLARRDGAWHLREDLDRVALPPTAADTVARRLAQASPDALALARIAAVVGHEQGLELLLAASGMDEARMFAALDELVERQFMVRAGGRYALCHDQVRETLYREMPAPARKDLHEACGRYLESRPDATLDELAHHFAHGHDLAKAVRYLERAGRAAEHAGADAPAVARWVEAAAILDGLDVADREARLLDLWLAIGGSGFLLAPREAARALDRAIATLPPDDPRLAGALTFLALAQGFAGRPTQGLTAVERGMAIAPPGPSQVALQTMRCANLLALGHVDACIAAAEAAAEALGACPVGGEPAEAARARVGAYGHQNARAYQGRRPDQALLERSIHAAETIGDRTHFTSRHYFGLWAAWTGRQREARAYLDEARQTCRLINAAPTPWMLYVAAYLAYQGGEHEEARQAITRAWRHESLASTAVPHLLLRVLEGQVTHALGDLDRARDHLDAARADAEAAGLGLVLAHAQLGLAKLAIATGSFHEARASLAAVAAAAATGPLRNPLHEGQAARLLAELELKSGDPVAAERHAAVALAIFADPDTDNPFERARTHQVLGSAQLKRGDRAAAAASYREAGDTFGSLENHHWLYRVVQAVEGLSAAPVATSQPVEARWQVARALGFM